MDYRSVEANGITFRVGVSGPDDGPAVLCLHGFPEGSMSWRSVMERLPRARMFAPDLRGYPGSDRSETGYDMFTLTDDVRALIEALGLERPLMVSHDWGGAIGWVYAHRYPETISRLAVVNCPHPKTLQRGIIHFEDWQPFRVPWLYAFQVPWLPEFLFSRSLGRKVLRWSFTTREGRKGTMDRALVNELVDRYRSTADLHPPIQYYRDLIRTTLSSKQRSKLESIYAKPIPVPVTLIWGEKDGALSRKVALKSHRDAGREVEWRPLPGIGHFVGLEAPDILATEIERLLP